MCETGKIVLAFMLGVVAYRDWKTKQISYLALIVMSILVLILRIAFVKDTVWSTVSGGTIGAGFFLISKCSRESIGYGDCFLILLLGIVLGGRTLIEVLLVAALLSSFFAIGLCITRGWKRKQTIPFVPFLSLAYVGVVLL